MRLGEDRGAAAAEQLAPGAPDISHRIPAVPRDRWTDATREVFARFGGPDAAQVGSKYNVIQLCAHHPQLATLFLSYSQYFLHEALLPPRLREIVVLRIAWLRRCDYEWARHVEMAREYGLGPEHAEAVKEGSEHPVWSELERYALRAVDQLAETSNLDDVVWHALAAEFGHAELLELLFLIGTYTTLAWVMNATGLKLEPGVAAEAAFNP